MGKLQFPSRCIFCAVLSLYFLLQFATSQQTNSSSEVANDVVYTDQKRPDELLLDNIFLNPEDNSLPAVSLFPFQTSSSAQRDGKVHRFRHPALRSFRRTGIFKNKDLDAIEKTKEEKQDGGLLKYEWEYCPGFVPASFDLHNLEIKPPVLVPGKSVTINVNTTTFEELTAGFVHVTVKLDNLVTVHKHFDVCTLVNCPVPIGHHVESRTFKIPRNIIVGPSTTKITLFNQNDELKLCMTVKIPIKRKSATADDDTLGNTPVDQDGNDEEEQKQEDLVNELPAPSTIEEQALEKTPEGLLEEALIKSLEVFGELLEGDTTNDDALFETNVPLLDDENDELDEAAEADSQNDESTGYNDTTQYSATQKPTASAQQANYVEIFS